MFLSAALFLASFAPQQPVMIKGHHIGETQAQFLAADTPFKARLARCHTLEPRVLTLADVQAMSKDEMNDLSLENGFASRKALEKLAVQGVLKTKDQRDGGERVFCDAATAAFETKTGKPFIDDFTFQAPTSYLFCGDQLCAISVPMSEKDFDVALDDLSQRTGVQPSRSDIPMHNAMGATWSNRTAIWETADLIATLAEDANPADSGAQLTVLSRNFAEKEAAQAKQKKSPLD